MTTLVSLKRVDNHLLKRFSDDRILLSRFKPVIYTDSYDDTSEFRSIDGKPLEQFICQSFYDLSAKLRSGATCYGQHNIELQALSHLVHEKSYNSLKVYSLDLEVDAPEFPVADLAKYPIVCIAVVSNKHKIVFSLDEWNSELSIHKNVKYIKCDSELDLLTRFINYWKFDYPHIVTGWNTDGFDLVYITNRMRQLLPDRVIELSPFLTVDDFTLRDKFGRENPAVRWLGIESLDLMRMYQKFVFESLPFYTLDYVSGFELGDGKLEFTGTHSEFRASDPQRFVDYCIKDAELVLHINDKRQLIQLACTVAWLARINISDVYSPVKTWDAILCNDMRENNIFPEVKDGNMLSTEYLGAYVKETPPGLYDWVVSFDVTSLYPSLIMQYNMCASTVLDNGTTSSPFMDELLDGAILTPMAGYCIAANKVQFANNKKAYMAESVKRLFNDRVTAKAEMIRLKKLKLDSEASAFKTLQEALKVTLNSLYGACGNKYFRFYDLRIAEAITASGQYISRRLQRSVQEFLKSECCIASDTDSLYLTLGDLIQRGDKESELAQVKLLEIDIDKHFQSECQKISDEFNCNKSYISLKRESIATRGIWLAKKRYALDLIDLEGVPKDEIKTTGLAPNMGSAPVATKAIISDALEILIRKNGTNRLAERVEPWYEDYKKEGLHEIGKPAKVGEMVGKMLDDDKVAKGCHVTVRAALMYNKYLGKQAIRSGDRVFVCDMIQPNPFKSNVTAIPIDAPKEMIELVASYVDYGTMFRKLVEEALGRMAIVAQVPLQLSSGTAEELF